VLGYVVIGPTGLLLLAEKVRVSATLPGNHQVKTLVTSKWHKIPLQVDLLWDLPAWWTLHVSWPAVKGFTFPAK
jgi:hypothetical protein